MPLIEPLEDRIAPAAVTIAPNGKSASYQDSAGDTIFVTTTKGTFAKTMFTFDPNNAGQLTELSLTGHGDFTGANLNFSIVPVVGGTDAVNIGYIDAKGLNLGSVTLPGDLGRIDVGGAKGSMVALGKLNVQSLGVQGADTQGGLSNTSTVSTITGTVGTVTVAGDVDGGIQALAYSKTMPSSGNINKLTIGGSLNGNNVTGGLGEIFFTGTLGTAFIGGGIEGGSQGGSGSISGEYGTLSKIGSVTVAGSVPNDPNPNPTPGQPGTSILGGSGALSGNISATKVGTVFIAGDVDGGTGTASGGIQGGSSLGNVVIDGSLVGGNFTPGSPSEANSSGVVFGGTIGSVTIGKNIFGGSGVQSGEILSIGFIKAVTVIGNVEGGSAGTSGSAGLSGVIHGQSLGSVTVLGSLIGGNANSDDPNQTGSNSGSVLSDTTIGSVFVAGPVTGGSGVSSAQIATNGGKAGMILTGSVLGGSGASSGQINVNGAVGKLLVTGNLTGGSGNSSGLIQVNGAVNSLVIEGSTGVTGGTADNTGDISTFGLLKSATIDGSIKGSSSGATKLTNTGYIQAAGIGTMTVKGTLTSGTAGSGGLDTSGAIRSTVAIGNITIGGLVGNSTNPAIVSAPGRGAFTGNFTSDVAIGKITIFGDTTYADILAGYNTNTNNGSTPLGTGVNADAQIGTVTINGNLSATNIIAGVGPGPNGFGTAGSAALSGAGISDLPTIISKISNIIITGQVTAPSGPVGTYGIAAQYIAKATVHGQMIQLIPGPDNDTFAAGKDQNLGNGVTLYEV